MVITNPDSGASGVQHGLDGDHHALLEQRPVTPRPVVRYLGFLVKGAADTVPDEFANHRISVPLSMLLNHPGNVADTVPGARLSDRQVQAFFGNAQQLRQRISDS